MNAPYAPDLTERTALRNAYRQDKAALVEVLKQPSPAKRNVRPLLQKLSERTDQHLRALRVHAGLPSSVALVAVGGYGRGELFPASDVDVLLLVPELPVENSPLQQQLEQFIGACWDTGLEIGSSVRTVAECAAEAASDVTIQTALLEARLIDGDLALFAQMQQQYRAGLHARAFFSAKMLEMRQRHNKFENTAYSLEPNCKESPGGLRDLHTILWVAKAAGLGGSWKELAQNGIATAFEAQQLERNEALISHIRARLHALSGRHEDRLLFDLQNSVAEQMGFHSHTRAGQHIPVRASEGLMRRYYWAAKAVTQLRQILLLNIEERLYPNNQGAMVRIDDRFYDKDGLIEVASDDLYHNDPQAILATFLTYESSPGLRDLSARTLRALYSARGKMNGAFRRDPENRRTFMRILQQPSGITHAFRLMNATSVLGRYLWAFRRIVGQMQHDLFHVYTVDQHTMMVLRNMRRFFMAEHAHEYPFCSQLATGWDKPWLLYLAALFHDIGKGRGGDHSQIGAIEVKRFCRQHGVEPEDATLVEFLVREHLVMSQVAQKQDTSDPDVIRAFAERVGDERRLTALYLLTVADVRGTSPKVWNAWKAKLLEDLYHSTLRMLGGRAPDPAAEIEARKREALVQLALFAPPHDAHKPLWDTLAVSYFMRQEASDIAWHARHLSRHVGTTKPIVRARQSPAGEGVQVVVYTPDRTDLFARICAYFDRAGFSILDARIHTARNGYALDTFQVITTEPLDVQTRELTSMIEDGLPLAIEADGPLPPPTRRRVSRRVRSFPMPPQVVLQPDEKAQNWLLEISASDRAGLLYTIAKVLAEHRVSVQLAKVSTLGERVEDSFLIHGPSLLHSGAQLALETELVNALGE